MRKIFLFLFLLPICCFSQQRSFINLGLEQGLAQSQVNMVHQDSRGYLWVATIGGLSRYDGHDFKNFYKNQGLFDNDVSVIHEMADGQLIFACLGGLSMYDGLGFHSYALPEGLVQYNITCLDTWNDSLVWVGTNGGGLLEFDLKKKIFSAPDLTAGANIRFLECNTGLVASDQGLFKEGRLLDPIFENVRVTDVEELDGELWVSTLREGLFIFKNGWQRFDADENALLNSVRQMCRASDGSLWFATRNGALCYHHGKWQRYYEENGLPYQNIRQIAEDREGNVWIATNGQGIYRYVGNLFTTYMTGSPLISDIMLSMCNDDDGNTYMGMFNEGLQIMDPEGKCHMEPSIPATDVWALIKDSKGRQWAGTSAGLYMSEGNGFQEMFREELPNSRITSLAEGPDGAIWIGHRDGLSMFRESAFEAHPLPIDASGPQRIRAITFMQDGSMYMGAENGLFFWQKGKLSTMSEEDGLTDNTVYALSPDEKGGIWIGTKAGLMYLNQDNVLHPIPLDGEASPQNINFILHSQKDELYVGTNQGLFRSESNDQGIYFHRYGITDGLPSLESNLNAIYQSNSGEIYFGTSKGVVRFEEEKIIHHSKGIPPFLHIVQVDLWAEAIDLKGRTYKALDDDGLPQGLVLGYKDNHLSFEFVGVRLSDPASVRYRYRLLGAGELWSPVTEGNTVTYSSLAAGDYIFQVTTVNELGLTDSRIREYSFSILAPLWLRSWAIVLEIASLLGLVYMIFRWQRKEAEKKQERVELGYKNRMYALEQQSLNSSMNRHFIFNALNAIQYYINKEEKRAANKYLTSFAQLIRKNLDSTADIWVSLHDELERLELYLGLEQMRFSDRFDYRIEIQEGLDTESLKVPAMTLQPYLENSIWHGILPKEEPGTVTVNIMEEAGRLKIIIEDDGIGIDESLNKKMGGIRGHEIKGLKITDDRIQLFSKITGKHFEIRGPYQLEEGDKVIGTRTELFIPL